MAPPLKKQRRHKLPIRDLTVKRKTTLQKLSFNKRISTLKSKAEQLSILCGVIVCWVCYEPDGNIHTWPEDRSVVKDTINDLLKLNLDPKKKVCLSGVLETRRKNLEGKKKSFALKEFEKRWSEKKKSLSMTELASFDSYLGNKLGLLRQKIDSLKEEKEKKRKGKESMIVQFSGNDGFPLNFSSEFAQIGGTQNNETWRYANYYSNIPNNGIMRSDTIIPYTGFGAPENFALMNSSLQSAAHGGTGTYNSRRYLNDNNPMSSIENVFPNNGANPQSDIVSNGVKLESMNGVPQIQQRNMGLENFGWMGYNPNLMLMMGENQISSNVNVPLTLEWLRRLTNN